MLGVVRYGSRGGIEVLGVLSRDIRVGRVCGVRMGSRVIRVIRCLDKPLNLSNTPKLHYYL